jgi:hypothetical protein
MVEVRERPPAGDSNETRVAVLGEDHGRTIYAGAPAQLARRHLRCTNRNGCAVLPTLLSEFGLVSTPRQPLLVGVNVIDSVNSRKLRPASPDRGSVAERRGTSRGGSKPPPRLAREGVEPPGGVTGL